MYQNIIYNTGTRRLYMFYIFCPYIDCYRHLTFFQDTLSCLASDEIKLASLKTRQDEIGEVDGFPDVEGAVASAVKKAIISQVNF